MSKISLGEKNILALILFLLSPIVIYSQNPEDVYIIKPKESNEVLTNPGMGFMTFQRFNGDNLNEGSGWSEGFPIEYQDFTGDLSNINYPSTTIAYWRIYWRFLEPEKEVYRWDMIDKALETARSRGQTLLLRVAPYGTDDERDVPAWYRQMVGPNKDWKYNNPVNAWLVDPEDPRYDKYFGGLIRALGERYDGHPDLEAVDISIVGAWGEGAGSELLSEKSREALINSYTNSFKKTPLIALLMDEKTNKYADSQIPVGWRVDCIGDLGFWAKEQNGWSHMYDFYPMEIINCNVQDDWKKSPVSFEICGTFLNWRDTQKYGREEVKYIFDQALKWHMSSFNAKSSPVPEEWEDLVNDWLKKMGYRFVLRRFSFPKEIKQNGKLVFQSWWENKGVAPCYKDFNLALKLKSDKGESIILTHAKIKDWLPGDIVYNDTVSVSNNLQSGTYDIQIAIVDKTMLIPGIKLAIEGVGNDGWYPLGKILISN